MLIGSSHVGMMSKGNPWDIGDATLEKSYTISGIDSYAVGLHFSSDGTKAYFTSEGFASDKVYQLNLSVPWDISTASYNSQYLSTGAYSSYNNDIDFSADGTKLYTCGPSERAVDQYNLSTAWLITSASYSATKVIDASINTFYIGRWSKDGTKYYAGNKDMLQQYNASTPWSVLSLSNSGLTDPSISENLNFFDLKGDGTKMYSVNNATGSGIIRQLSFGTAGAINTLSVDKSKTISSYDIKGLYMKPDGTKLYTIENGAIKQYAL